MTGGTRGRRPVGSGTREAIAAAARRQFGELGYRRASLRSIAVEAGVDPRLVLHFFGSKQELFAAVVELPFDPATAFDLVLSPGEQGLGRRLATFLLDILDSPEGRKTITGLIRAAASEEEAAAMIRELLGQRLLLPLASRLAQDRPELRASLVASQVVGLAMARHVVGIPALTTASRDELVAALAPVLDHYLTGPIDPGVAGMSAQPDAVSRWPEHLPVGAVRVGRTSAHYDQTVRFYRDIVGLPVLERFEGSFGEDGTIFGLPDTAAHLEIVRSTEPAIPVDRIDTLVFYLPDAAAREPLVARMAAAGLEPAPQHPYWQANGGVTYRDPDGREVVFVSWVYGVDRT